MTFARRVPIPLPPIVVVAGLCIGLVPGVPAVHVSSEFVLLGLLPPLLYASAREVSPSDVRKVWWAVTLLAVGLVVLTAGSVALVTHLVRPEVNLAEAFVFGAVLASTDPIAVTALSRGLHLPPRVVTIVRAESLFNDATSLLLFQMAVAAAVGSVTAGGMIARFALLAGGGVAIGAAIGFLTRRLDDRAALVVAYATAVAAWAAHASPVTAVIVAGLMPPAEKTRAATRTYVYALEGVVFALVGLQLAAYLRALSPGTAADAGVLLALVTAAVVVTRALAFAVDALMAPTAAWRAAAVLVWAGTRGALPLAAALAIPTRVAHRHPFPQRPLLVAIATGTVVVSLVVQGTTLGPLVRRMGAAGSGGSTSNDIR